MNLTGGEIGNIPIVAIKKEHQGHGLSKIMLKASMENVIKLARDTHRDINNCIRVLDNLIEFGTLRSSHRCDGTRLDVRLARRVVVMTLGIKGQSRRNRHLAYSLASGHIVFHNDRKKKCVCNTVRCIIKWASTNTNPASERLSR